MSNLPENRLDLNQSVISGLTRDQQKELLHSYNLEISELSSMFPQFTKLHIEALYQQHGRNFEQTLNTLLKEAEQSKTNEVKNKQSKTNEVTEQVQPLQEVKINENINKEKKKEEKREEKDKESKESKEEILEKKIEEVKEENKNYNIEVDIVDDKVDISCEFNPKDNHQFDSLEIVDYFNHSNIICSRQIGKDVKFLSHFLLKQGIYQLIIRKGNTEENNIELIKKIVIEPIELHIEVDKEQLQIELKSGNVTSIDWIGIYDTINYNKQLTYCNIKNGKVGDRIVQTINGIEGRIKCLAFSKENYKGGIIGYGKKYISIGESNEIEIKKEI
ncbi:Uncharacterized protein QTN25_010404 [Entamoeba marina]